MIIEPGILNSAHAKGIKYLGDMNGDGHIDQQDLTMALAAKKAAAAPMDKVPATAIKASATNAADSK